MKNSENIDKIFSEGLHAYERQPRPQAWEKLEVRLQKPQRKVLSIWLKYASTASVVLLLGVGIYWFNNQENIQNDAVAIAKKSVIIKKQQLPILENVIPEIVKVERNNQPNTNLKFNRKIEKVSDIQLARLSAQQIIKVEEIKQIAKMPTIESKKIEEQNTISLVMENVKHKAEEEIIILNIVDTKLLEITQRDSNKVNTKKETRLSKIWQQLKRAKNGENVNWNEVGIKPRKILARTDVKIENILTKIGNMDNR